MKVAETSFSPSCLVGVDFEAGCIFRGLVVAVVAGEDRKRRLRCIAVEKPSLGYWSHHMAPRQDPPAAR